MEKFDWKLTTKINIVMLKMVGLWPEGDQLYKLNLYTVYATIAINVFINGHTFFQAMNIFFVYSDLEALTATIFVTSSEILAALKVLCYIKNLAILKRLVSTLENELFQPESSNQIKLVRPSLRLWRRTYFGFWVPGALTLLLWSIFPVLDGSVSEYRLPFSAWYPHDTKTSPLYEITYLYQVAGIWFMATANLNIDTLISALMMYTGTQCDILCDNLKNLNSDKTSFNAKLIKCVEHHRLIVR
jgi:hypothetical protein